MNKSFYKGISTNNLNNIDFELLHNKITLLMGKSGSGKSSLAVNTIHQISYNELSQLMNLKEEPINYSIEEYKNILPSIALLQENYNKNPRSTIATYFKIDIFFKKIFAYKNNVPTTLFQFNTFDNACEKCLGTGIELVPDPKKIIDYDKKIIDIPFKNWNSTYKDLYQQLLVLFCKDENIDINQKFRDLNKEIQNKLLYGESKVKYKIIYKAQGKKRTKTTKYIGLIKELELLDKITNKEKKFFSEKVCSKCHGYRFSQKVLQYQVYEKNIGELYSLQINELIDWIYEKKNEWKNSNIEKNAFLSILEFLEQIIKVKLDYLNLNRSIPSLSGGELQRLRFAKAINSQFNNFIFDEPSSGLHPSEIENILNVIINIKNKKNTILIIEHNEQFKKIADKIIFLENGEIVKKLKQNYKKIDYKFFDVNFYIDIKDENCHNIKNLNIKIPGDSIVAICGKSGSGKTSFAKFILPNYYENATYLDQSPIKGNKYSIVATYLGIFDEIRNLFAKTHKVNPEYFSFSHSSKGKCHTCNGTGVLKDKIEDLNIICPDCKGKRFSKKTLSYKINGLNIYEYLTLPVQKLNQLLPNDLKKTKKVLNFLHEINLEYISLFREISTLSGGESQRMKLCSIFFKYKKNRTYILDEPFKGLDIENKYKLINFLYSLKKQGNTIFYVEHDLLAINYSSYIIEFGPGSGIYGGKILYNGERTNIYKSDLSIIKNYL